MTGIGASKRIVVWDTTIAKMSTPQIVFVAGHEMGHYVLHHIPKGLIFAEGGVNSAFPDYSVPGPPFHVPPELLSLGLGNFAWFWLVLVGGSLHS